MDNSNVNTEKERIKNMCKSIYEYFERLRRLGWLNIIDNRVFENNEINSKEFDEEYAKIKGEILEIEEKITKKGIAEEITEIKKAVLEEEKKIRQRILGKDERKDILNQRVERVKLFIKNGVGNIVKSLIAEIEGVKEKDQLKKIFHGQTWKDLGKINSCVRRDLETIDVLCKSEQEFQGKYESLRQEYNGLLGEIKGKIKEKRKSLKENKESLVSTDIRADRKEIVSDTIGDKDARDKDVVSNEPSEALSNETLNESMIGNVSSIENWWVLKMLHKEKKYFKK